MEITVFENQGFPVQVGHANSWAQFAEMAYNRLETWNEVYIMRNNIILSEGAVARAVIALDIPNAIKTYIINNIRIDKFTTS